MSLVATSPIQAQITPDNSLGNENSIVTPNATIKDAIADLIEGGAIRDSNLFHSFSEFNVSDGGRVYFASPNGIANILTRVTGNNISEIFGTLGVDGAANLFLLNPNGIVFGENAALDLNGSFFATTAESFVFGEGLEFSATQPETAPLLTVNLMPGLQMGSNSGVITVQDKGHLKIGGLLTPILDYGTPAGLEVQNGQTLGLIASEINFEGGIISASGGNIELIGVESGVVQLDNTSQSWQLDTSLVESFGDINFTERALVSGSGFFTSDINLRGRNITIEKGSAIGIQNFGIQPTKKITVNATDSILLSEGQVSNESKSSASSQSSSVLPSGVILTENLSTGQGGNINVSGKNLKLVNGSGILARSFGDADTGNINVDIEDTIEVRSYSRQNFNLISLIGTNTFSSGDAGEVDLSAQDLTVAEGGTIAANNLGSGRGGTVKIDVVEDLTISGFNPVLISPSAIGSTAYRTGDSGNLIINTASLSILDGAAIDATTLAEGDGGQLRVNATEFIDVSGKVPELGLRSAISSHAIILNPILRQVLGLPDVPSGDSGNITLNTPSLNVTNSGVVTVSNDGSGNSGSLEINSNRIFLNSDGNIIGFSATGQGGNIALNIEDSLLLDNGSVVSAEARSSFASGQSNIDGGNININADTVTLLENSNINANAFEGNGGNINISTQGLFVSSDSRVTASSEYGLDGTVNIDNLNGDRDIELEALPQNPLNASERVIASCGTGNDKFAIAGNGGLPENPLQTIRGTSTWNDLRFMNIEVEANNNLTKFLWQQTDSKPVVVEAQEWRFNEKGNVVLIATNSSTERSNTWINAYHCFERM